MSCVAVGAGAIVAGGAIAGSIISSNAAGNAAQTEAAAANSANQLQYSEYEQQLTNEQPWLTAGQGALGQLSSMAENPQTFTMQDFLNNQDPAYQFDTQQGEAAMQRSAAAQGGLQSTGTLTALNNYAQGQASNEYQNAYNRFMNTQNTQFNRLSSLAGLGQTATAGTNAAGANMANQVGNTTTSLGSAMGASQIAQGNIWGNTLGSVGSTVGSNLMQAGMLNSLYNPMNGIPGVGAGGTPTPTPYGAGMSGPTLGSSGSGGFWATNPYSSD